jgi:hypothetical protein
MQKYNVTVLPCYIARRTTCRSTVFSDAVDAVLAETHHDSVKRYEISFLEIKPFIQSPIFNLYINLFFELKERIYK